MAPERVETARTRRAEKRGGAKTCKPKPAPTEYTQNWV
jgi:hypothetical protein